MFTKMLEGREPCTSTNEDEASMPFEVLETIHNDEAVEASVPKELQHLNGAGVQVNTLNFRITSRQQLITISKVENEKAPLMSGIGCFELFYNIC
ncbi:hypothetical protein MRX96_006689 [Rhipicephalus microplus]